MYEIIIIIKTLRLPFKSDLKKKKVKLIGAYIIYLILYYPS